MKKKKKKLIKQKQKEKLLLRNNYKQQLKDNIHKYNNNIACPIIDDKTKFQNIDTNSWFDIKKLKFKNHPIKCNVNQEIIFPDNLIKTNKSIIKFSKIQKEIVLKWFTACEIMFNQVIKYFKTNIHNKTKYTRNYKKLRSYILKNERDKLISKYNIPTHVIDRSIQRACSHLETNITNKRLGYIKTFRLRYLKKSNPSKIITIEKEFFSKKYNTFCSTYLGKYINSNCDLKTIKKDCTLHYNKNKFVLLIPIEINSIGNTNTKTITIDPGVREFINGLSDDHLIKLGSNISTTIKSYLGKIDNMNNKKIPNRCKRRYYDIYSNKIKNRISDLHWKTIKYLTNNYKTIFIGKWSTKNIGLRETSILGKMTKRIASRLRYYEFLQKLQYKCNLYKINLVIVNEAYTSKLCSCCGWENNKLGGNKKFSCKFCDKIIDRDINGARNIFIKSQ